PRALRGRERRVSRITSPHRSTSRTRPTRRDRPGRRSGPTLEGNENAPRPHRQRRGPDMTKGRRLPHPRPFVKSDSTAAWGHLATAFFSAEPADTFTP